MSTTKTASGEAAAKAAPDLSDLSDLPAAPVLGAVESGRLVRPHHRDLPLRVGTRSSPLALWQTRAFISLATRFCPALRRNDAFLETPIATSGDVIQSRRLAEIGGKGLFAKEIHEALLDGRIDLAVHSLKDLETELPPGIALACVLPREDPRDALVLGPGMECPVDPADPLASLPYGAVVGTCSLRRQAQLLAARPDLQIAMLRGNVQTRLARVQQGQFGATLLAIAGLRRLDLEREADIILDPSVMLPAACQGIIGVTVREEDGELIELLGAIQDLQARLCAEAERAVLRALDGNCRTPIGAHAVLLPGGRLRLTGLIARPDGSFLLRRTIEGSAREAARLGRELGLELRADSPADVLA
ncbi:MAG: hydroxymethylbilane synthase [Rhodovarius sp.]|nr:hydroxymethylbilane synthase [Rhodovarius sp.]